MSPYLHENLCYAIALPIIQPMRITHEYKNYYAVKGSYKNTR